MSSPTGEADVGITCFANDLPGFSGIIKQRYSDFQVHEVTEAGEVVRITSLEPPPPAPAAEGQPSTPAELITAVRMAAGDGSAERLAAWLQDRGVDTVAAAVGGGGGVQGGGAVAADAAVDGAAGSGGAAAANGCSAGAGEGATAGMAVGGLPPPCGRELALGPFPDKQLRKAVHTVFKARLSCGTEFSTEVDRAGAKPSGLPEHCIRVVLAQQDSSSTRDGRKRKRGGGGDGRGARGGGTSEWPGGADCPFLRFALYKENMDTQHALGLLARSLGCGTKSFGTAGTKDKRGCTVQHVTAWKVSAQRVAAAAQRLRGCAAGNYAYVPRQLTLGMLGGNEFQIVLRDVRGADAVEVAAAAQGLAESGFINYYGLQRFGSGSAPTHRVGAALLRGDWRGAVRLLLATRPKDRPDVAAARSLYLDKSDIAGALRAMPTQCVAERAVLESLKRGGPSAFLPALQAIPRNLRSLYAHAYQSYLFNVAASHRVATYGARKVVTGDLVLTGCAPGGPLDSGNAVTAGGADAVAVAADAGGAEAAARGGAAFDRSTARLAAVHVVTEAEAAAGVFQMAEVVLPLPGARTIYPAHATGDVYRATADADGVPLPPGGDGGDGHGGGKGGQPSEFSLLGMSGDYRHVLQQVQGLEHELMRYADPAAPLALTDLERLGSSPAPLLPDAGPLLALRLRFRLPPSAYATMALRELLKESTSRELHAARTASNAAAGGGAAAGGAALATDHAEGVAVAAAAAELQREGEGVGAARTEALGPDDAARM